MNEHPRQTASQPAKKQQTLFGRVRTWKDGISLPIPGVVPLYAMGEISVDVRLNMGMTKASETYENVSSGLHRFIPFVGMRSEEASLIVGLTGYTCLQLPEGQVPPVASLLYGSCTKIEEAYRIMLFLSRKRSIERGMMERAFQSFQPQQENRNWSDYLDADSRWARDKHPPCLAAVTIFRNKQRSRSGVFQAARSVSAG